MIARREKPSSFAIAKTVMLASAIRFLSTARWASSRLMRSLEDFGGQPARRPFAAARRSACVESHVEAGHGRRVLRFHGGGLQLNCQTHHCHSEYPPDVPGGVMRRLARRPKPARIKDDILSRVKYVAPGLRVRLTAGKWHPSRRPRLPRCRL